MINICKPKLKQHIAKGKWTGGFLYLERIEDIPDPINEQTPQIQRCLKKIQDITSKINYWEVKHDYINYNGYIIKNLKHKVKIGYTSVAVDSGIGYFYRERYVIEIFEGNNLIDNVSIISRHCTYLFDDDKSKYTIERNIILDLLKAMEKKEEVKKENARKEFYDE